MLGNYVTGLLHSLQEGGGKGRERFENKMDLPGSFATFTTHKN